jgi:D-serine deaminase-like pyridoxal phosphate-dependent protein
MRIDDLATPALLVDLDVLQQNLERMQAIADRTSVRLRPHVKTHKCAAIAHKQRRLGARGITVSTIAEAQAFARAGFDDITWALPNPLSHLSDILALSRDIELRLLVDDESAIRTLEGAKAGLHVWLKVDCGYHRAGVDPRSPTTLDLIRMLSASDHLIFDGILTHAGHAYWAKDRKEIQSIASQERAVMLQLAETARAQGLSAREISIGSTPTMSVSGDLTGISEIRPGNYVFYDGTQAAIGSCDVEDCALTVLSSVISSHASAEYFVIDAGALALSKDPGPDHIVGHKGYGAIFADYEAHAIDPDLVIERLSQEHAIVRAMRPKAVAPVGARVRILEHHSCLAAAQFDEYCVVRGDEVVDRWHIDRQR